MDKEEEQAAERVLRKAIEDHIEAHGWNKDLLLTSYMVICAQTGYDDDGDLISAYPVMYMDGLQPDHTVLGLLETARRIIDDNREEFKREPGSHG